MIPRPDLPIYLLRTRALIRSTIHPSTPPWQLLTLTPIPPASAPRRALPPLRYTQLAFLHITVVRAPLLLPRTWLRASRAFRVVFLAVRGGFGDALEAAVEAVAVGGGGGGREPVGGDWG